jgi:hypothetical protein
MEICNGISDLLFHMLTLMTFLLPDYEYYAGQKILAVIVCQFKKKIVVRTLLSS